MRKTMRAKKMTKKAMAMALTMSMILSMTFTVFAEEEGEASQAPAEPSAAVQEVQKAEQTAEEAYTPSTTQDTPATGLIEDAKEPVTEYCVLIGDQDTLNQVIAGLNAAETGTQEMPGLVQTENELNNAAGVVDDVV